MIAATWLAISYLIGRYSPPAKRGNTQSTTIIAKTILAGSAVITIFVGHSWIYQIIDAQTRFRGFLIPLISLACILSSIAQTFSSGIGERRAKWLVIGNKAEKKTVTKELACEGQALQDRTTVTTTSQAWGFEDSKYDDETRIAVGSIEENEGKEIERLLQRRERGGCVIPLLNWCEQELQRIPPELVHSEWLIQAEGFGLRPGSITWRLKRFGDVLGAILLIVGTAPILLIAGILVWVQDGGPIFYHQIRSGLYGRPIRIWKLRSMRVNAEKYGAQWATKSDPRVTRVGRLIRATRIDELPQLFSVISGDLSLIGPRPERPEIEEELEKVIPNYRVRHWIRPGLSGWAQVCYPYGASTEDSRLKLSYDLYYLRNASPLLDVLITMKTIRLVIAAKGASPT